MQEEVENRTVNLAISTTKLTGRTIIAGIRKYLQHREKVKMKKARDPTRKYGKFRIRSFFIFLLSITDHAPVSSLEPSSESLRQFP